MVWSNFIEFDCFSSILLKKYRGQCICCFRKGCRLTIDYFILFAFSCVLPEDAAVAVENTAKASAAVLAEKEEEVLD